MLDPSFEPSAVLRATMLKGPAKACQDCEVFDILMKSLQDRMAEQRKGLQGFHLELMSGELAGMRTHTASDVLPALLLAPSPDFFELLLRR